jgi:transposase InsO family protein
MHTPWMNQDHFVEKNVLHADGVLTGSILARIGPEGTFPLPVLNSSKYPFKVKRKMLITFASPLGMGEKGIKRMALDSTASVADSGGQIEPIKGGSLTTSVGATSSARERAAQQENVSSPTREFPGSQASAPGSSTEGKCCGCIAQVPRVRWLKSRGTQTGPPAANNSQEQNCSGTKPQQFSFTLAIEEPQQRQLAIASNSGVGKFDNPREGEQCGVNGLGQDIIQHSDKGKSTGVESPSLKDDEATEQSRRISDQELVLDKQKISELEQKHIQLQLQATDIAMASKQQEQVIRNISKLCTTPTVTAEIVAQSLEKDLPVINDCLGFTFHTLQEATQQINTIDAVDMKYVSAPQKNKQLLMVNAPIPETDEEEKPQTAEDLAKKLAKAAEDNKLPPESQGELKALLYAYTDIFRTAGDPTHSCPLFEQAIPLIDETPVYVPPYPLPQAAKDACKERVKEFQEAGIVKPSKSPFNAPVWMVPKKDNTWRMCIDYRALNKKMVNDPFPLPRIEEILDEFHGSEYFSAMDMFWGFYHIKIKEEDTHKLAFSVGDGRFEFLQLPMGLKIAPAVFQRTMNMVFNELLRKFLLVYMDDVVVYSKSIKDHFEHLNKVFTRMRDAGLRFKIEKCQFFQHELPYLGFIISKEGIRLDPAKVESVLKFPTPSKDVGKLQSFLGMVGYFKRHIPGFASIARPLYSMLKGEDAHKKKQKGKVPTPFKQQIWGREQDDAVAELKRIITNAPVLKYPDFSRPFILTTDASAVALGFVLSQVFDTGEHPIAYGSRLLRGSEVNYGNTDREMLAVVKGVQHFRTYLYGRHFRIRTDHQAIVMIVKGDAVSRRVLRWTLDMEEYNYTLEYCPATKMRHADALSRMYHDEETNGEASKNPVSQDSAVSNSGMVALLAQDPREWKVEIPFSDWAEDQKNEPEFTSKFLMAAEPNENRFAVKSGILYQLIGGRYVPLVPRKFRRHLIMLFHDPPTQAHQGSERTYLTMKKYVYWAGMRTDVEAYIDTCDACQRHKRRYGKVPMQHQVIPKSAFHTVTMDVVGPVPRTEYGEEYILVMQDMLTRWIELAPLKRADTVTIVDKFITYWVLRHGPPARLLTDRGTVFVSDMMKEYCRLFGVTKSETTAYRPQGNGANERMHQEMRKFFRVFLEGQPKGRWRWLLPQAAWAYNTNHHLGLGMSPYEAVHGNVPSLGLLGVPQAPVQPGDDDNIQKVLGIRRKELIARHKLIQDNLLKAQTVNIARYNKHARAVNFKIGDWVLHYNHGAKTKWDPAYTGPWKIIQKISPVVFELDKEGHRKSVHATYLKPYKHPLMPDHDGIPGETADSNENDDEDASNESEGTGNDDDYYYRGNEDAQEPPIPPPQQNPAQSHNNWMVVPYQNPRTIRQGAGISASGYNSGMMQNLLRRMRMTRRGATDPLSPMSLELAATQQLSSPRRAPTRELLALPSTEGEEPTTPPSTWWRRTRGPREHTPIGQYARDRDKRQVIPNKLMFGDKWTS